MRGKNIIWLSLITLLLGVTLVGIVPAATPAKLYVDPPTVKMQPPGEFTIDINVDMINDLYAYGMTVDFAPYVSVLVVSKVTEGPFLSAGGVTYFRYRINSFAGEIDIGCTLLGAVPGVSGDGTLFSVTFIIAEAGESQLDLLDTGLLNSNLQPINHNVQNGYYYGPTMNLMYMTIMPGRKVTAGTTLEFHSVIKNMDTHKTMDAQVRFDILREDGWRATIWGGQAFVSIPRAPVYLYVNEYNEWLEWPTWYNVGASVIGTPDGDYTWSNNDGALTSSYGFDDLTLYPGDVIGRVTLEGYCQYPNGPTEDADIDMYTTSPTVFDWLGSLYGGTEWAWVSPRWTTDAVSDVVPELLGSDATALNGFEVAIYNYYGDDPIELRVDSLRLKVEFSQVDPASAPTYEVGPKQELVVPPAEWATQTWDVGKYYVTCTVYYTYMGYTWIQADKVQTRHFWIVP